MRYTEQATVLVVALALVLSPIGSGMAAGTVGASAPAAVSTDDGGVQATALQTGSTVLYRANAGSTVSSSSGPDWQPLADYMVAGEDETSGHGQPSTIDDSVPSGTPTQIWETERWDPSGGEEMQYEFDVQSGQQVEVRLYFYDGFSGTDSVGDRVFDVSIEGQTVLDDFDIVEKYGDDTAAMESFTVTSDGTVDVDFGHVTENPQVNAIEIVSAAPQPDTLGGPSSVDFGTVVTGNSATETVTLTNLGGSGDPSIDVTDLSVTGTDAGEFSVGAASQTTLSPGESADVPVTFTPADAQAKAATLEVTHSGANSPLTVDLTGEGASDVPVGFSKSKLQGFSAGNPTAIDFGPDGRVYVSTQGGTVYALDVERTGEDSYQVANEVQIDAIKQIPNHNDNGDYNPGETNRQITGLTAGGTASQPVVYVSSSDPSIDVGQDDDDTDTNSGAISRLTMTPGSDGTLQSSEVDHDVLVLGLPRSEENHATNGLDLSNDGDTLYVAQGGHTNKGAPGDNFGHTPEFALSAAILEIDLAQIASNYQAKNLGNYDAQGSTQPYPDLEFYYAIPTIQNDDATDGDDLPFGGNDGINQAKLVEGGPVQIYSPGYRNPYDLVVAESGQVYAADHGPNGGWGGQPADASGNTVADASSVTNHPNEDGSFSTNDQLIKVDEGEYGGHAAPIRANPTAADIYDASGNVVFDITSSNSPVPSSMVDPAQADYIPPTSGSPDPGAPAGSANTMVDESGNPVLFGPTGGTEEYTASNFGGAMAGDLLQVELGGDVERVELNAAGDTATNVETLFNTGGPLGIAAQDDDEVFPGTVWTANHGGNDVTVFEPNDYGDGGGQQCTGADDAALDEDGDGYDNADEIDAGTDPCSSSSTPADFDGDGTSNLNDDDDDNDGQPDTSDPFAVDPDDGTTTTLPVQYDLAELSLFGDDGQGWTGLMTNGQDDYQDLYDPTKMTVGGAAEVLTVEEVPQGDAYSTPNTQQYAFQFGVNPPDEPFTVESTVASFPENPEDFQSAGIFLGTGDQSNYAKLVVAADGGTGGVEFAQEEGDTFTHQTSPNVVSDSAVTGSDTTLSLTVDPTTDPTPDDGSNDVAVTAEYTTGSTTTEVGTAAVPASWLDTSDGSGLAVGVISTSNGASSTFPATWTDISVTPVNSAPTVQSIADQTVTEGESVDVAVSASDPDSGDTPSLSLGQAPAFASITDAGDGTGTVTLSPQDGDAGTYTVDVVADDGAKTTTETFAVTVEAPVATGEVVARVNAGGAEVAATDGGPAWSADTGSNPSQYVNADGDNGLNTYSTTDTITLDGSVPSGTPASLFQTERYDVNTTADPADDTEMQWSFDVQSGQTYEVRLYFAEIFLDSSNVDAQGPRVFDVNVEGGDLELDDYNIYQQYGHDVGVVESFQATPSDGTLDVSFLHEQENPKLSAVEVVAVDDGTGDQTTLAEAIADENAPTDQIGLQEIQAAINWWATGSEVPDTGGETISLQEMQSLINMWATEATVGDGSGASVDITGTSVDGSSVTVQWDGTAAADSDHVHVQLDDNDYVGGQSIDGSYTFENVAPGEHTVSVTVADTGHNEYAGATDSATVTVPEQGAGSALVEITPDGGLEATTYGSGTYQVTNTGEKNITAVSFDLSTASLPDMVFDPQGTAGDPTGEGLNIVDEGGTGITTAEGGSEAFSQPHNGQNADDGYDVMTVEFDDFQNGETATFWADNDPTSIKGATVGSQEAGPVSGLELARSTVTVTYEDGTTHTTQLMGDGSAGGATANVTASELPAPTVGAQDVSLSASALDGYHSAATVASASQTITVSGQPGETVTLVRVEGELTLQNVPDADGDGEPGYDIEAYEANDAEDVEYYTVTLDANGEATVPVTLTNTTSDGDDNAGYNYFVAAHGEPTTEAGLASNVVVLHLDGSTGGDNTAPTVESITDTDVAEGGSTTVDVTASDADGDTPSLSVSGPGFVSITDDGDGTGTVEISPGDGTVGTHTVTVTADDGQATASEEFAVYVDEPDQDGQVVFAANAGGSAYTAADGTEYQADTNFDTGSTYSTSQAIDGTQDDALYQTERYGGSFGYDVPVPESGTYEVTLQFAEIFQGVSDTDSPDSTTPPTDGTDENDRLFDVAVEGQQVLSDYDIYSEVGPLTATEKTYTVEVTDGTLNVDFSVVNDNAKLSALTVEQVSSGDGPSGPGSADVTVNDGAGIDASTYSGGSMTVTNTGDQQLSSVTFDLSESLVPDAVFDPEGTAGDAGAKGLTIDSESGDGVGVVSTADGDVFSQPHNGQDGADGYDAMTVEFGDFDPGETVAFSVDIDPTTIKGASTTGGAGSVSGLELAGSAVTVGYADGSTQATDLFGDGSAGGAQASATADDPAAPTLGVDGVGLQSTDFPAHEAATVGDATQTLTVSGPAGATVELVHAELSEPPTDGYDIDAYEGDNAQSVDYQTVTLDSNGEATTSVTLTESNLHYFVASVQDGDGDTGQASNAVVLDYSTSAGEPQVLHRVNAGESTTLGALDDGPDWTGVAGTSSPYLVSVAPSSGGSYCGGTIDSTTDGVPSSTPDAVFDCERYGNSTWAFDVESGTDVEVRLYLGNQFSGTSEPGDRAYNVSIEGTQVLTQYDPVADVGHATGTMKSFTVTSDGTIDVEFDQGAVENPQVNAIEIVEAADGGSS